MAFHHNIQILRQPSRSKLPPTEQAMKHFHLLVNFFHSGKKNALTCFKHCWCTISAQPETVNPGQTFLMEKQIYFILTFPAVVAIIRRQYRNSSSIFDSPGQRTHAVSCVAPLISAVKSSQSIPSHQVINCTVEGGNFSFIQRILPPILMSLPSIYEIRPIVQGHLNQKGPLYEHNQVCCQDRSTSAILNVKDTAAYQAM